MNKGRVFKLRAAGYCLSAIKQNNILIIMLIFLLCGLIFGVLSLGKFTVFGFDSQEYISIFKALREAGSFWTIFYKSLTFELLVLLISFIFGTTAFGIVLLPPYIFFFGLFYGQVSATLYSLYSLKGIAFHTIVILPPSVLLCVALLLSLKAATDFSLSLTRLFLPTAIPKNMFFEFKSYCLRFLILIIVCLFSALLDGIISVNLLPKISFF